jgi:hypothetical protein
VKPSDGLVGPRSGGSRRSARGARRALVLAAVAVFCGTLAAAAPAASTDFVEAATSPEAAGFLPAAVAAADFDGDGDRDLAVTNAGSGNVTIQRNDGAGDFEQPASSPEAAGTAPFSVAAADLDGDSDRDLAVANLGSDDVTILRNNGSGNFAQAGSSPEAAGDGPGSVAAADLDGDGDQDLAVANEDSDNVTILRNNGAGNFVQPASSPEAAGSVPLAVAAADLDGDSDQDLAVAATGTDTTTILSNNGSGNFAQASSSPEAAGDGPAAVAAADFDGDSDQDLAVANENSDNLTVLRNNGAGNFVQPASSPEAAGDGAGSVAAADFDGDGDQDLAVANFFSDDVTILRNNGSGNFAQPASSPEAVGDAPNWVVAAPLDGDADPDLATANNAAGNVTILGNQ